MRVLKITAAAVVALIIAAALLAMVGIPSGIMTAAIQAKIERETGYRLTVSGASRIGIWPSLNVTLHDVALQDPTDRDGGDRLTIDRVEAEVTLPSVWSDRPHITALTLVRPVAHVPLLRQRNPRSTPSGNPAGPAGAADAGAPVVDRVTATDGAIEFFNLRDRVDRRIDDINARAAIGGDGKINIAGNARWGTQPFKFDLKAMMPDPPVTKRNIPFDLVLDMPGMLPSPLSARAEARLNGSLVMLNGLTGTFGGGAFNGWASADIASKPLVKLDLDFRRLDIALPAPDPASSARPPQPWSNTPTDLRGLNYVDAQIRISAAALNIGGAQFAPASIEAALAGGILKANVSNLGAYGGHASGDLIVDAPATGDPVYALRGDLAGIRALPLLQGAAGFGHLDGRLQAKIALRSSGASPRALMSNVDGTASVNFRDGAIRGLNVARMIRSLTSGTLSRWQESAGQTTDLTELAASFRIDRGVATNTDLVLVGPLARMTGAGAIDLASKSLAFRVEPELVTTTKGQGRADEPAGLGIPVVIEGPWSEPRIYPDVAGILDHPEAAYAKLREMGKGLFGTGGALDGSRGDGFGGPNPPGGALGETLGNLLLQSLGGSAPTPDPGSSILPAPAKGNR